MVSSPPGLDSPLVTLLDDLTDSWAGTIEFIEESDEELAQALREGHIDRLRFANPDCVPYPLRTAAALNGDYLADTPVSTHGRVELLWYFQEQSLSHLYHRYGNQGSRSEEERAAVL